MPYDEKALRRPDFQADSVPVTLANGQEWFFPKPYVELFPKVENGRVVGVGSKITATHLGPEFADLMQKVEDAEGAISYAETFFPLAVLMLSHNYALPDEAYSELLAVTLGNGKANSDSLFQEVLNVALGFGPKASAAGDGSPSST